MAKNKKLIYTVNLNNYDVVAPVSPEDGYDYILFTDDKDAKVRGWKTRYVKREEDFIRQTRDIKLRIHKYVRGYELFVYIDANLTIVGSLNDYVRRYFKSGLLLHTHKTRECIFEEAKRVISLKLDDERTVVEQMRRYSMEGMRRRYGLFHNNFLIRDKSTNDFTNKWYQEIVKGSYRDQISLPYAIWKHRPNIRVMHPHHKRRYVQERQHKGKTRAFMPSPTMAAPKVWYFTPGRGDKNLGRAYNEHCSLVPDTDWICIRDGDTMFLNPYWPKQIEDIIIKHGSKFPLISCVTNRLGLEWQLPYGFSENPDILHHTKIANEHYDKYYDDVVRSVRPTAGLFMLFPKTTWLACPFSQGIIGKGGIYVDNAFANDVMKNLGHIGIARGIYLFHFYRFATNKRDVSHLQ